MQKTGEQGNGGKHVAHAPRLHSSPAATAYSGMSRASQVQPGPAPSQAHNGVGLHELAAGGQVAGDGVVHGEVDPHAAERDRERAEDPGDDANPSPGVEPVCDVGDIDVDQHERDHDGGEDGRVQEEQVVEPVPNR